MTVGVENEFTALSALFKEKYFSARLLNFESIPPNHDAWVVLFAASFLYPNLHSGIEIVSEVAKNIWEVKKSKIGLW